MNYTPAELERLGVRFGADCAVHRTVEFFGAERVVLGDDVRVDCFCLLSAGADGIRIGSNVHLAAGCYVFGGGGRVSIEDFCGVSSRVTVYTVSDDFTEGHLTNPTVPEKYRKVARGPVTLRRHALVGANVVILPGVTLGTGSAVGAMSCVNTDVPDFAVVSGQPVRGVGRRPRRLLDLEREYLAEKARPR